MEKLVAVFAPHHCLSCGAEGPLVCSVCLDTMRIPRRETCFACNRLSVGGRTCVNCRRRYAITGVTVATYYDEPVRRYITAVKYDGAGSQAALGTALLVPLLGKAQFDLVTSVPASPSRLRVRGYNQSQILAKAVAKQLSLPYLEALGRSGKARQVGQSRQHRLEQIKGQFYAKRRVANNSRVLLIDDVITTGATMSECAKQLRVAGAGSVWGAAIAKH